MKPKFTHHLEVDVPDDALGMVQRFLTGVKGASFHTQTNGTERKRGDKPSKMNASTKKEVIVEFLIEANGHVPLSAIVGAVESAGFKSDGLGSYMSDLVEARLITRVERGVYSAMKALPSPKKKGGSNG